jgi:carboxymethylenebutenolidase
MNRLLFSCLLLAAAHVSRGANDMDLVNSQARARLDKSPRHLEWVTVKHDGRDVKCFVGYPEVKDKATAVVLIHEIFGLSDWMRGMVDQFAEAGYIAIAPDFLSGMGPDGGGSDSFRPDAVRGKIQGLSAGQVNGDLDAAVAYVSKLPACNGKVVVGGFCWGGGKTFGFATHASNFKAGLVFYGSPPDADDMAKIKMPVYGFYGGNDARITATVPKTTEEMKAAGKTYEPVVYEGAGHGFMRAGEASDASEPNRQAREQAWKRVKEILAKI